MIIKAADRIKELRELSGLTQSALARQLSVTRSSVNAWEMGTSVPSIDKILDLAEFFHVSTDYLLGKDDSQYIDISYMNKEAQEIVHRMVHYCKKYNSLPTKE